MRTLVYFASGSYKKEYQDLNFDKIYLIDHSHRSRENRRRIFHIGKVTCLGMDALESINYLKKQNVKIDCFVSINEGLWEGGGSYKINSDMFLGYVMPLLKDNYIHIINLNYYHYEMDLPFEKKEITENDENYINPLIFSSFPVYGGNPQVFQMTRIHNTETISINPNQHIFIKHDSIWNHYDELDLLAISLEPNGGYGPERFFYNYPKTIDLTSFSIKDILCYCQKYGIKKIGFTPWALAAKRRGELDTGNRFPYTQFINHLKEMNNYLNGYYKGYEAREYHKYYQYYYPREIFLFHLNQNDYQQIRTVQ